MRRGLAAAAMLCAACSVLPAPRVPEHDFVVLDAVAQAAPTPGAGAATTVAIDRVRLPAYLERPEVVTRVSDNQIAFSTRERWGETLSQAVPRVLALELGAALAADRVVVVDRVDGTAERVVEVSILRFERTAAGRAELHARWTVRGTGGASIGSGELRASEPVPAAPRGSAPAAASAASLSRLLAQLGARIAADLHAIR